MKKILVSTLLVLTVFLTACGSSSTNAPTNTSSGDMAIETQLAVGTLKLTGTDQDISTEQAEELVLYWQVYQELSQSDTAAQAEIDGLVEQIEETMTTDQMQAITDMNIVQQDVFTAMQGVTFVSSNASDSTVTLPSGSGGAGGPPADGGTPPDGGGMPSDMGEAAPASGVEDGQGDTAGLGLAGAAGVPSTLVQAVIESLQQKITA